MARKRVFVSFSSTDIHYYRLLQAWNSNERIGLDFIDLQLKREVRSEKQDYIRRVIRPKIKTSSVFILIIGEDTKFREDYVYWETETAIEENCRLIGLNLDGSRRIVRPKTPKPFINAGAQFVPFNYKLLQKALNGSWDPSRDGNWHYKVEVYRELGL